jgi:cell shape-determining protein MreC
MTPRSESLPERLRKLADLVPDIPSEVREFVRDAADELETLRASLAEAQRELKHCEEVRVPRRNYMLADRREELAKLKAENERLREALDTYAQFSQTGELTIVSGFLAKKALERSEETPAVAPEGET